MIRHMKRLDDGALRRTDAADHKCVIIVLVGMVCVV